MVKPFAATSIRLNEVDLLSGTIDPSAAGLAAPIGSKYWRGPEVSGDFTKTGAADTAWTPVPTGIYFNVKDGAYGATGDGVTDDRGAIQKAIDDASVIGGTVYFPPGTYLCGKSGENPYSFLLDNVDKVRFLGGGWGASVLKQSGNAGAGAYDLFRMTGGSDTTEFELITFDQSGLSNVGVDQCHLINVVEASIVKIINCRFTGGIANAGAYVHAGGTAGLTCELIWVTGCDMRDAGGPIVWFDGGVSKAWILDNDMVNTATDPETILVADTVGGDITDIKIKGNHIENSQQWAIRLTSPGLIERISITNNLCLGWVSGAALTKSQFQNNEVYISAAGHPDPAALFDTCTYLQFHKNIIGRASTADAGLVAKFDTCTRSQAQRNLWVQGTTGATSGLIHALDCSTMQFGSNLTRCTDAGATVADAYLVEAVAVVADNLQFTNEQISADAGTWDQAIHVKSHGANIGVLQITGGIQRDCDIGVLFDDNGGGPGVFTDFLMVAGVAIDADTAAFSVTVAGVYIRIGANASTFGANLIAGTGTPAGNVTARVGSQYLRLDGGANTTLYIKESGADTAGWVAK